MIPKNLRLYVGGEGRERKVLLEDRRTSTGLLLQGDVCAQLQSSELGDIRSLCERVTDVYASIGVLTLFNSTDDEREMRYLSLVTACNSAGKLGDAELLCVTDVLFVGIREEDPVEFTSACKQYLTQGTFFFGITEEGESYDLTVNFQSKINRQTKIDSRFLWNRSLLTHPLKFFSAYSTWFVSLICGSVSVCTVYAGAQQARAAVISRVSSERAGARFQVRGVDDNGCVANFVETEQILQLGDKLCSYLQIRGSVPVFWEQSGLQVGSHKLSMTRGYELTQMAYDKHMTVLKNNYGMVMILNLLSSKPNTDECYLSSQYQAHQADSTHDDVLIRNFDYHAFVRGGKMELLAPLYKDIETFVGYSGFFRQAGAECQGVQEGVLRTNCLDCIDRTNSVQKYIAHRVLYRQLEHIGAVPQIDKFTAAMEKCWHSNANLVSRAYCGTGALKTAGGKMGKLTDATRSVKRAIKNNFLDDERQEAIEDLLMYPDKPLSPVISKCERFLPSSFVDGLLAESRDFSAKLPIRVSVGTWNSNGGRIQQEDQKKLADWLLDAPAVTRARNVDLICDDLSAVDPSLDDKLDSFGYVDRSVSNLNDSPDVVVIGLQELVDLTAGNIVSSSQSKRSQWSSWFQDILCRESSYILLSSLQLVGVCLFVFVKSNHVQHCTDICIESIKTGMKGKTGNKGGVVISFSLYSTSLCFVCAHLAAGQTAVNERNKHYDVISEKAMLTNGMEIDDHDYVFWCGDFNYRIDLPNHRIRELVKEKSWYELQCADQLTVQRNLGKAFTGFNEGPLDFAPTYKFDLNSDYYDTSDKFRSPAWCDRVLWRCRERTRFMDTLSPGTLVYYGYTDIKSSDHRPVLAVVDIEVRKIDLDRKLSLYNKVFSGIGPPNPTVCVRCTPVPGRPAVDLESLVTAILGEMQQFGEVYLVRVPEGIIHFTFKESVSAVHALQLDEREVLHNILDVTLQSTAADWQLLLALEPPTIKYRLTPIDQLLENMTQNGSVDTATVTSNTTSSGYGDTSSGEEGYTSSEGEEEEGYTPVVLPSLPKKMPPPRPPPPARPPPPQLLQEEHLYAEVIKSSGAPPREEYADYRATTSSPPPSTAAAASQPPRPSRPARPPQMQNRKSFLAKTGESAREFLAEKLAATPGEKKEVEISGPYGVEKRSDLKQYDDGTFKISLDDGRVIVYEKGSEPLMMDPGPSNEPRPARPARPVRPPDREVAAEKCVPDPEDVFSSDLITPRSDSTSLNPAVQGIKTPPRRPSPPSGSSTTVPPSDAPPRRPSRPKPVELSRVGSMGNRAGASGERSMGERSSAADTFSNPAYAELSHIRSQGTLGSVIELAPPAPPVYANPETVAVDRPARPPRPSRPSRPA